MNYLLLDQLRVKTPEGIRELQAGEIITLSEDMARGLIEKGKVRPLTDCFDPDGILTELIAFYEGRDNGNEMLINHIDQMFADGMLKPPYGFKLKGGHIGDYWIISDTTAREKLPPEAMSFTIEELRPILKTCKTLNGKVVEVKYRASIPTQ